VDGAIFLVYVTISFERREFIIWKENQWDDDALVTAELMNATAVERDAQIEQLQWQQVNENNEPIRR